MSAEQLERNRAMLNERIAGCTYAELAEQFGLREQTVHTIVQRTASRHIEDLELRLLANTKTGDVEALLIPDHAGPDFDQAVAYLQWVTHELAERGVQLKVHYRPTHNGVVFGLEDVTQNGETP